MFVHVPEEITAARYHETRQQKGSIDCMAVVRKCRREGFALPNGHFYYSVPGGMYFMTEKVDHFITPDGGHSAAPPALEEL